LTATHALVVAFLDGLWRLRRPRPLHVVLGLVVGVQLAMMVPLPVAAVPVPRLLFGLGPEADGALTSPFTRAAPVRLLTSWYTGPKDLAWMTGWRSGVVPKAYADGYALHLIVYDGEPQGPLTTAYGPACGKAYPLSRRFLPDMQALAQTFAGDGRFYVTLFTEFQTYPCVNNQWVGAESYYRALQDQYLAAVAIFHQYAPNSRVSLGWGGWQARWDDPVNGGGRSLFPFLAAALQGSDFQSFQAMQTDGNVTDVRDMTYLLGQYGPVMLAHYRPDNGSPVVVDADVRAMLTDGYLADVTAAGLFAISFMDDKLIRADPSTADFIERATARYAE